MIWYKFRVGDYITHTLHLSDAEDLAYRRLLDLYYLSESPIPLDTDAVARKLALDGEVLQTSQVRYRFLQQRDRVSGRHRPTR